MTSWQDFDTKSVLERDVLLRALPLVATQSTGDARAIIDMAGGPGQTIVGIGTAGNLGATPEACIDLLQLRPLLFGTAWKVLDLLLEAALAAAGETSGRADGSWPIATKQQKAAVFTERPPAISATSWRALMTMYGKTVELRHSLVHRAVYTDPAGALVGHNRQGAQLSPVTPEEQEAFGRAVLRATELVLAATPDTRVEADLVRHLGKLRGHHQVGLPTVPASDRLPELTAIVDGDPALPYLYTLDVPALRARSPWPDAACADLIVRLRDRPGQDLRGRLEHAPDEVVSIDPAAPPGWLSS